MGAALVAECCTADDKKQEHEKKKQQRAAGGQTTRDAGGQPYVPGQPFTQGQVLQQPIGLSPAKEVGGAPPDPCRVTKALLIGINYVGTSSELKGCQNDATDMQELLTSQYGFSPNNIRLMLDRPDAEQPTRKNIMQGVQWLVAGAQPGDCLFFHYSGHGGQQEDPTCFEEDCMNETLIPVDYQSAGQIVDDEIFEAMIRNLRSGVKITAVMDCCHSGTGLDLPFTLDVGMFKNGWACDENPCHSEGHVVLISGCCDDQTSADIQGMYCRPRGALTEAYIETLKTTPYPSYEELLVDVRDHLEAGGYSQFPMLSSSQMQDTSAEYCITGKIMPNQNPTVGRSQTRQHYPKQKWGTDDPFEDDVILIAPVCVYDYGGDRYYDQGDNWTMDPADDRPLANQAPLAEQAPPEVAEAPLEAPAAAEEAPEAPVEEAPVEAEAEEEAPAAEEVVEEEAPEEPPDVKKKVEEKVEEEVVEEPEEDPVVEEKPEDRGGFGDMGDPDTLDADLAALMGGGGGGGFLGAADSGGGGGGFFGGGFFGGGDDGGGDDGGDDEDYDDDE